MSGIDCGERHGTRAIDMLVHRMKLICPSSNDDCGEHDNISGSAIGHENSYATCPVLPAANALTSMVVTSWLIARTHSRYIQS